MADFTRFTNVEVTGEIRAAHKAKVLALTGNYTLSDIDKMTETLEVGSASAVTLTLGGAEGQTFHIENTNASDAITLKNVSGDSGTSLAAGKIAYVICHDTANRTKIVVLN